MLAMGEITVGSLQYHGNPNSLKLIVNQCPFITRQFVSPADSGLMLVLVEGEYGGEILLPLGYNIEQEI